MEETKIDLGWRFDTHHLLLVALPDEKYSTWSSKMKPILVNGSTKHDTLDTIIEKLTHITVVLPCLHHYLNRLCSLKYVASRRRSVNIQPNHRDDFNLALLFLKRANTGINMNYISYCSPTHSYKADVCPWGIGGYSSQGRAR